MENQNEQNPTNAETQSTPGATVQEAAGQVQTAVAERGREGRRHRDRDREGRVERGGLGDRRPPQGAQVGASCGQEGRGEEDRGEEGRREARASGAKKVAKKAPARKAAARGGKKAAAKRTVKAPARKTAAKKRRAQGGGAARQEVARRMARLSAHAERLVELALEEDLLLGDATSEATIDPAARGEGRSS